MMDLLTRALCGPTTPDYPDRYRWQDHHGADRAALIAVALLCAAALAVALLSYGYGLFWFVVNVVA